MAGIDKTYIKSWEQYAELRDFFLSCGKVTDDYGNVFEPIDYLWEQEETEFKETIERLAKTELERYKGGGYDWSLENGYITQEEYDNFNPYDHVSIPIMNTPTVFDVWMIRNCQHIEWLQDDLKNKYSGGWSKAAFTEHNDDDLYYQILNHTSCYDTYRRNGLGENIKIRKDSFPIIPLYGIKKVFIEAEVQVNDETWRYHENEDYWCSATELHMTNGWTSSCAYIKSKTYSPKAIFRKLKKWNLPENAKVKINVFLIGKKRRYLIDFALKIRKKWNKK